MSRLMGNGETKLADVRQLALLSTRMYPWQDLKPCSTVEMVWSRYALVNVSLLNLEMPSPVVWTQGGLILMTEVEARPARLPPYPING